MYQIIYYYLLSRVCAGDPTLQWTYGCERDHGTNSAYNQYGFDGDDLITLDLNTGAWNTSKNPQAVNAKNEWDPEGHQAKSWRSFLNSVCFEWLNSFMSYGRENLERKGKVCGLLCYCNTHTLYGAYTKNIPILLNILPLCTNSNCLF